VTTEYLLNKELEHVLAALTPENELVMRVCLQTGLRVSDALSLKRGQIKNRFWVTEGKTGKRRMVGLTTGLIESILGAKFDPLSVPNPEGWCFPHRTDRTRHRTRQAVWNDVKRAAKAFRLPQNVAPHSARKVYAVDLMGKYGSIGRVQKVLAHRYPSTTALYAMADSLLEKKRKGKPRR
jgi:integrase